MPASIWRRINARSVASSSERSRRNGVTSAVPQPVNMYHLLKLSAFSFSYQLSAISFQLKPAASPGLADR